MPCTLAQRERATALADALADTEGVVATDALAPGRGTHDQAVWVVEVVLRPRTGGLHGPVLDRLQDDTVAVPTVQQQGVYYVAHIAVR